MAYLNATTAPASTLAAGAASLLETLVTRYKRNRVYRQTYAELSNLSHRELADLGLHRSQLRTIALESAQEAKF